MPSGPVLLLVVLALIAFGALLGVGGCLYVWKRIATNPAEMKEFLRNFYATYTKTVAEVDPVLALTCPACGHTKERLE